MFDVIGPININVGNYPTSLTGLTLFITNIVRFAFLIAGIWAFFNFILAGYDFLGSNGDPKKITSATQRIWVSIIGLVLIVGSFILAAIIGYLIFGDPLFILKPNIYVQTLSPVPPVPTGP